MPFPRQQLRQILSINQVHDYEGLSLRRGAEIDEFDNPWMRKLGCCLRFDLKPPQCIVEHKVLVHHFDRDKFVQRVHSSFINNTHSAGTDSAQELEAVL